MIDLGARIAWYQDVMRPDDPAHGVGIADWGISHEFRPDLVVGGKQAWGCICSPGALPDIKPLTPEDIAAKKAHLIARPARTPAEVAEVDRTIFHECGHILVAEMRTDNRSAEENAMHSLDALFAKLTPEQGIVLARAMKDPTARTYSRADTGDTMPEEEKKAPPEGEVKKDGPVRDEAAIMEDLVKAAMAGQPTDELVKELVAAKALANTPAADPPEVEPEPPMMGMKPETAAAYTRAMREAKEAKAEALGAIVDANPHLTEGQRALVRSQPTVVLARQLAASYERPKAAPEATPKIGMPGHPSTKEGGGTALSVRARARSLPAHAEDLHLIGAANHASDTNGVMLDVPGNLLVLDLAVRHRERRHAAKQVAS